MNQAEQEFITEAIQNQFQYPDYKRLIDADRRLYALVIANPYDFQIPLIYNEFRIANITKLPKTRPHILTGAPFHVIFPTIHITPLFKLADVICLTPIDEPLPYRSTIHCHPSTQFLDILERIPEGFKPDFYWDQQIEYLHYIPAGIEKAPFPIIAGLCHTFQHQSIEYICELFDSVLPISQTYGETLKKKYPNKIINIPFGLNWASFANLIQPQWKKDIDVCLTFSPDIAPTYGNKRSAIIELTNQFKAKYGNEFVIEITHSLSKEDYIKLLQRSRITINIAGIHGPYNYRTIEAMCAGSMVFQYEWEDHPYGDTFSELFVEGVHGVTFNLNNFESKLLDYLRRPLACEDIAKNAYLFQKDNYSYEKLYLQLIDEVQKYAIPLPREVRETSNGSLYRDLAYYYQNNAVVGYIGDGLMNIPQPPKTWVDFNNLMIYLVTAQLNPYEWSLAIGKTIKMYPELKHQSLKSLYHVFYESALKIIPQEYLWILKWNYFMINAENRCISKLDAENMLSLLTNLSPIPFEEQGLFFKYYLNNINCPSLEIGVMNTDFQSFNIDLLKNINDPQARANLFRNYAITVTEKLIQILV